MSAVEVEREQRGSAAEMTVDELSAAAGLTVRTTRYYASLGLIPQPERRGRMAWYAEDHLARLRLIPALQAHGFSLQEIERFIARLPADASVEDLTVIRALIASWTVQGPKELTRRQLEQHAKRRLREEELDLVLHLGLVRRVGEGDEARYSPAHGFETGVKILDLDIPIDAMREAGEAIGRHAQALAAELAVIMNEQVIAPFRAGARTRDDVERLERTIAALHTLPLDAIVSAFQRAMNDVVAQSLHQR